MSHFSVLVITKNPGDVERALQPFHEYECTGIHDQYVEWFDMHDEVEEEYNDLENTIPCIFRDGKMVCRKWDAEKFNIVMTGDLPVNAELRDIPFKEAFASLEEFAEKYHGYDLENMVDGRIGRITNPNAKWDWWVVGGRWSNFLHLKTGERADQARKKDIDFDTPKQEARARAQTDYAKAKAAMAGGTFLSWPEVREKFPDDIDKARDFYHAQETLKKLKKAFDGEFFMNLDAFLQDVDTFLHKAEIGAISTYAVLKFGNWMAHGEMGWFGMSSDEKDNWQEDFGTLLEDIPDDAVLTVVDCHI